MAKNNEVSGWVGWVFFAGFMMIVMGVMQIIAGLTALFNSDWLVVTQSHLLLLDFTTWGWVHLLIGIAVLLSGFAVMQGSVLARTIGVMLAMLSAVANMAYVNVYPIWSITLIVVDIVIIYALTVHGGELKEVK